MKFYNPNEIVSVEQEIGGTVTSYFEEISWWGFVRKQQKRTYKKPHGVLVTFTDGSSKFIETETEADAFALAVKFEVDHKLIEL